MNSTPVEAQSISSLSHLLANPPRYPRNPTHAVHEPLVLYIVRVPGSKGEKRVMGIKQNKITETGVLQMSFSRRSSHPPKPLLVSRLSSPACTSCMSRDRGMMRCESLWRLQVL
jgi:hypothetical protein